jgi:hypothetical protein
VRLAISAHDDFFSFPSQTFTREPTPTTAAGHIHAPITRVSTVDRARRRLAAAADLASQ